MENKRDSISTKPLKKEGKSTRKFTLSAQDQEKLKNFDKFNCSKVNNEILEISKDLHKDKFRVQNDNVQKYLKIKMMELGNKQEDDNPYIMKKENQRKSTATVLMKSKFRNDDKFNLKESEDIKRKSHFSNNNVSYFYNRYHENSSNEPLNNNNSNAEKSDILSALTVKNSLLNPNDHKNPVFSKVNLDKSQDSFYSKRTDLDNSKREIVSKLIKSDLKEDLTNSKEISGSAEFVNNSTFLKNNYKIDFQQFEKADQNNSSFDERPLFKFKNLKESHSNSENEDRAYKEGAYIQTTILIYPDSNFKLLWDYLILVFIIYSITVSPTRIAFNYQEALWSFYFTIDFILDVTFLCDIIINFFVPVYDTDENLVLSFKHISKSYITSWFFMDLISSLPLTFFQIAFQSESEVTMRRNDTKLDKYLRLLRIFKWSRIIRIIKVAKHYNNQNRPNTDNFISKFVYDQGVNTRLFKSGLIFLLLVHLSSCLWIFIGQSSDYSVGSWLKSSDLEEVEDYEVYIASIYFTLTTIYSIGYGDILSTNMLERVYNCVFMMIGVMVFSFAISSLSTMFLSTDKNTKKYEDSVNILDEMRLDYNISNEFYEKIKNSLRYQYLKNYSDRYALLSSLPRNLKNEIIIILHQKQIKDLNFFCQKPYDFILYLLPLLISIKLNKGELLFCLGEFVEEMYLCVQGCLSLHLGYMYHNIEVAQIRKNYNFGDILMYSNEQSPFDLKVKSTQCELLVLKKIEYSKLKMKFPEILVKELKKSLEDYKFIMERRRLFIEAIVNTNSDDVELILKAVKKVRYQTYDKATLNLLSVAHKKEKNAEYLKKLVVDESNEMEKKPSKLSGAKYKKQKNLDNFDNIERGLEEEMKINSFINIENTMNYLNFPNQNETLKKGSTFINNHSSFAKEKDNSFGYDQSNKSFKNSSVINKCRSLTVNELLEKKKDKQSINKSFFSDNKNISDNKNKNNSNIKINYYHIKNNIDKYFYLNGHARNEKDPNPQNEARQFIDKLNQKTTDRLKKLLDKKSNQLNKIRMKKTIKLSSHTRRKSISMKKIRSTIPLKKVSSKKESHRSNMVSKNSHRNYSQLHNQSSSKSKERRVKFAPSQPSNNSIFSINLKKGDASIQNLDINHNKHEALPQEIHLKTDSNKKVKESNLNEDVIYKNLNNKMDDLLKLINLDDPSASYQSSSSD